MKAGGGGRGSKDLRWARDERWVKVGERVSERWRGNDGRTNREEGGRMNSGEE